MHIMFLFKPFGSQSNVGRVGKNQTFDNDTFIGYIEYYASDYYDCTSKYWQICILSTLFIVDDQR